VAVAVDGRVDVRCGDQTAGTVLGGRRAVDVRDRSDGHVAAGLDLGRGAVRLDVRVVVRGRLGRVERAQAAAAALRVRGCHTVAGGRVEGTQRGLVTKRAVRCVKEVRGVRQRVLQVEPDFVLLVTARVGQRDAGGGGLLVGPVVAAD